MLRNEFASKLASDYRSAHVRNELVLQVFLHEKVVYLAEEVPDLGDLEAELYGYLDGDFIDRKVVFVGLVRVVVGRVALGCLVILKFEDDGLDGCENEFFHVVFEEATSALRSIW
jgi:hypothetical protein